MIGVSSTLAFLWSLGSYFALVSSTHGKAKPSLVILLLAISMLSSVLGLVLGLCGIVIDENKLPALVGCFLNFLAVAFWAILLAMGLILLSHFASSPMLA